jgi:hypothetical protein
MHEQFDDVARLVASPTSRRQVLHLVSNILLGSLVSSLWPGRARAADITRSRPRAQNNITLANCPSWITKPKVCQIAPTPQGECCWEDEVCCATEFSHFCCSPGYYCVPGKRACSPCPISRPISKWTVGSRFKNPWKNPCGPGCCAPGQVCAYWTGGGTCVSPGQCKSIGGNACGSWCCTPGRNCLYDLVNPARSFCS